MSLQKRIDEDLKDAMRAKNAARLSVLRLLKAVSLMIPMRLR